MASAIDISGLTLNPLETENIADFIVEKLEQDPVLGTIHQVWRGVKVKEQITFAQRPGLTGIAPSGCTLPNSGATAVMTEKYWEPEKVSDTLIHCQEDVNALFKAYYRKVNQYAELFDITGSDLEKLLMVMLSDTAMKSVWRLAWFGDKSVAGSEAAAAGLIIQQMRNFSTSSTVYGSRYSPTKQVRRLSRARPKSLLL